MPVLFPPLQPGFIQPEIFCLQLRNCSRDRQLPLDANGLAAEILNGSWYFRCDPLGKLDLEPPIPMMVSMGLENLLMNPNCTLLPLDRRLKLLAEINEIGNRWLKEFDFPEQLADLVGDENLPLTEGFRTAVELTTRRYLSELEDLVTNQLSIEIRDEIRHNSRNRTLAILGLPGFLLNNPDLKLSDPQIQQLRQKCQQEFESLNSQLRNDQAQILELLARELSPEQRHRWSMVFRPNRPVAPGLLLLPGNHKRPGHNQE